MSHTIVRKQRPENADILAITTPLQQFNDQAGPATTFSAIVLHVVDTEGNVTGGLFGKIGYDWLHIEYLIVPESARGNGLGTSLMQKAEAIALESGCTGVYLDTLAFQALGFYEKLGYTIFGRLEDFPKGGTHYFLRKRLFHPQA